VNEVRPEPGDPFEEAEGGWDPGWITYLAVLAAYILLGMEFHWLLSWTRGFIFPFVGIWLIPFAYLRWRARRRSGK
jgi:hypothetical protein